MLVRTANNHVDGHGMKKEKAEWVTDYFETLSLLLTAWKNRSRI